MDSEEGISIKYSSYTPAQKRATQKYREKNKDKVNQQRKEYYLRRKETDPAFLEYKREKAKEYYQRKKEQKRIQGEVVTITSEDIVVYDISADDVSSVADSISTASTETVTSDDGDSSSDYVPSSSDDGDSSSDYVPSSSESVSECSVCSSQDGLSLCSSSTDELVSISDISESSVESKPKRQRRKSPIKEIVPDVEAPKVKVPTIRKRKTLI